MATVEIRQVRKTYPGHSAEVIKGIDCRIEDGEFLVMLGPSGCGKSTLLRMVAGLEAVTRGEIAIGGRTVNGLEPKDRDIAMVFQNYALYPHMTVFDNMAYGLKIKRLPRAEIERRVREAAELLEIGGLLDRKPAQLSGGQRQRVAMGRAIVREPAVFLFDEPLSNLDAKLRTQMRVEIKRLQARLGVTSLYVTHDQVEAMTLADRMVVMNHGKIEQIGSPAELYSRPETLFVAGFLGSPSMSFLDPGDVGLDAGKAEVKTVGLRPEDISLVAGENMGRIHGRIELVENLGADHVLYVTLPSGARIVSRVSSRDWMKHGLEGRGETIDLHFDRKDLHLFDRRDRRIETADSARTILKAG